MSDHGVCACCGRPRTIIPINDLDALDGVVKPRREQLALDALVMNFPNFVTGDRMKQALYEDVGDQEPDDRNALMSHISKLRKKLKAIGWDIECSRFIGYRLVRLQSRRVAA